MESAVKIKQEKSSKGLFRLYSKGKSTLGYIRGEKITKPSEVQPGELLIVVNHQQQTENLVQVIANPNPLNISFIHCIPVYSVELKRKGLTVKNVKGADPQAISQLSFFEVWRANRSKAVA